MAQKWHNYENIIKSKFYKPLLLLAHPARFERATLSTAKTVLAGIQGQTATNKDNNISKITALNYCRISPNMAWFCKLMAQNWHKNSALVHVCRGFFLRSKPLSRMSQVRTLGLNSTPSHPWYPDASITLDRFGKVYLPSS